MHVPATQAQLARTLAASTQPGTAQVAWGAHPFRVRHAVDGEGNPLLLCRTAGELDSTLRPVEGESDTAAVLCVTASVGRHRGAKVWISGWVAPLSGAQARDAAIEFAAVNPLSDLLGIGDGHTLYRMDVAEVRLECPGGHLEEIDPADYAAAEALPVFGSGSRISSGPVM